MMTMMMSRPRRYSKVEEIEEDTIEGARTAKVGSSPYAPPFNNERFTKQLTFRIGLGALSA